VPEVGIFAGELWVNRIVVIRQLVNGHQHIRGKARPRSIAYVVLQLVHQRYKFRVPPEQLDLLSNVRKGHIYCFEKNAVFNHVFSPSNDCPVAAAAITRCAHLGHKDERSDSWESFFKPKRIKTIDQT
jgi:hypothetical protein